MTGEKIWHQPELPGVTELVRDAEARRFGMVALDGLTLEELEEI